MSNSIEDFIISLGFDTSKVRGQIQALHKELEKLAVNVDAKRVKSGLATTKEVANNEVKVAKDTAKAKEDIDKKSTKKQVQNKEKLLSASDKKRIASEKEQAKLVVSTRKQAALTRLRNQIAEYERGVTGPSNLSNRYKYYERGNASIVKINAFTEEIRGKNVDTRNRMKSDGSLKSFDNASAAKAEMDMMKASNSMEVLRTRMSKMGMDTVGLDKALVDAKDLNSMKMLIEKTKHQINLEKELNRGRVKGATITAKTAKAHDSHIVAFQKAQTKAVTKVQKEQAKAAKIAAMRPTQESIAAKMSAYQASGLLPSGFNSAIMKGAMQQSSDRQADQYIKASMRAAEYSNRGVGNKKDTMRIISEGNVQVLSKANMQLASMNAKMAAIERRAIGSAAAFGGMQDSARNMVREMASVYAMIAATSAINQTGQTFEGLNSAMLAATGNPEDAADQMKFMIDLSKRLGLSVKDITDQYIKFKFAANGKLDTEQIEEIYTSTAELGTVLGLSQEKMKLTFNSMSQMMSKTTVMSEELNYRLAA